jgi:hypothetical protein
MKQKPKPKSESGSANDIYAVGVSAVVSVLCAGATAGLLQYTLDSFNDSRAMAGLITDSGLVFDDKNTERQLSQATLAMKATRDIAIAMAFGSTAVLGAIIYRVVKNR